MSCLKLTESDYIRMHDYSEKSAYSRIFHHVSIDTDGNMLTNGEWSYTWNGENRLIVAEKSDMKLEFVYDFMGRRISKKVYTGSAGNWTLSSEKKFVYNGYKQIAEFDANSKNDESGTYVYEIVKDNGTDFIVELVKASDKISNISSRSRTRIMKMLADSKKSITTGCIAKVSTPHRISPNATSIGNQLATLGKGGKIKIPKSVMTKAALKGVLELYSVYTWANGGERKAFEKLLKAISRYNADRTNYTNCGALCDAATEYIQQTPGTSWVVTLWWQNKCHGACCKKCGSN